jgi:UDP-N-acetylmuramoyl-tripeptide--D-alanyl-D-alanine ligase
MAGGERRVAVLGDMLELGPSSAEIHAERGRAYASKVDLLVAVGPLGRELAGGATRAGLPLGALHLFPTAAEAATQVADLVRPGDAVLVKASRGVKLEAVVDALLARFPEEK